MQPRAYVSTSYQTFKTTWASLAESSMSEHAQYCVRCIGQPYAVLSVYGGYRHWEFVSLMGHPEEARIGAINQHTGLPIVIWYPEGDWMT